MVAGYMNATVVNLTLPVESLVKDITLQWRQPRHSGSNTDEWAIDDVFIAGEKFTATNNYIINEDFYSKAVIP